MPRGWKQRFPEFAKQLLSYQKKGKNKHDDAPDVLAAIYEAVAIRISPGSVYGVPSSALGVGFAGLGNACCSSRDHHRLNNTLNRDCSL